MPATVIEMRRRQRLLAQRSGNVAPQPVMAPQATAAALAVPQPLAVTARASAINPAYPVYGTPTTVTVRDNFEAAKDEIEALQAEKLDLTGGVMSGPITLAASQIVDGGTF
jgi:hypothetical protein